MSFRRRSFLLSCVAFAEPPAARLKFGDAEWMRRFRVFIRAFNDFVEALNDEKLDRVAWRRMRDAWDTIDID